MEQIYSARYLVPISAPPLEEGALCLRDGRIIAVGPRQALCSAYPRAAVVDFEEAILLPPLVNAHTHLELTHFPRWAAAQNECSTPQTFVDWILQVIRVKRATPLKDFPASLNEGIGRSLAAGTGAVGDILSCFPARAVYGRQPLRGRLFLETLGRDPAVNRRILQSLDPILEEKRAGRMELGLAPHAPYTLSAEYLAEVFAYARRRHLGASLHLAESAEEVRFLMDSAGDLVQRLYPRVGWSGMVPPPARRTPAAYLEERGGLKPSVLLVHGVHLSADDIERVAQSGCSLVLCPRSNARLQVGHAPLSDLFRHGVPLALGTDSLASCDTLSVWDEIAFARDWFAGQLAPAQLLMMATAGGARALGLEGEMGQFKTGLGGSFQVLRPSSLPVLSELEEFLCAAGRSAEVSALYLDGEDVLQKG